MQISIISIVYIFGIFQGLFLASTLLVTPDGNRLSNKLLAFFFILTSIVLVSYVFDELYIYEEYPYLLFLKVHAFFLLGPLFYFYVKSHLDQPFKFKWKDLLHLIPFTIFLLISLPFYFGTQEAIQETVRAIHTPKVHAMGSVPIEDVLTQIVIKSYSFIYLILSFRSLKDFYKDLHTPGNVFQAIRFDWLKRVIMIAALLTIISMVTDVVQNQYLSKKSAPAATATLIIVLGYMGLKESDLFSVVQLKRPDKKYQRSSLTEERSVQIHRNLILKMEVEKLFKKYDISLPWLAKTMNVATHHLSHVINDQFGTNYFSLISKYRIEEAKGLLAETDPAEMNITEIAYEVGFNSISAFNAAFRKFTGTSPMAFRKQSQDSLKN